ncbi:hypothetical protein EV702DRAFT_1199074 [Suillus placidus]|uniref:HAM1-like C-terminal domain-containing protein n=1 Tax=Suillus placidus TaxID=48579 RepID=A0A9P6ZRU7_9AGAM|nr:hypothetical protein EV702DRAFT_1199074 [Suillus placidus]
MCHLALQAQHTVAWDDAGDRSVDIKCCAEYRCLLEVKPDLIVSEECMSDTVQYVFERSNVSPIRHVCRKDLRDFQQAITRDADLQPVRCLLDVIKNILIPRTKYIDREIEFVLENLDISSLSLLPGHVYICNITDVDITAPAICKQSSSRSKEVSFFYRDKVATIRPKDFASLMECGLPQKGINIDLEFCLIPNTSQGLMERESLGQFFKIERVEVNVAENIDMQVKQSNHPILASVFWPVIMLYFRQAISHTLEEQIR